MSIPHSPYEYFTMCFHIQGKTIKKACLFFHVFTLLQQILTL